MRPPPIDAGHRAGLTAPLLSRAGESFLTKTAIKPFLISKDEAGAFRITIRETRYNSQRYPLVTSTLQENTFKTATAASAYAREHLGAAATDVARK
jgi:hypothetical protein